ncbi:MAG: hypothetical protein JW924_11480 [Fusobacteriaceae bacterium]|nr:hypothetical protein [Fusobacteriaceae bacterium]
MKKLLLVLSVVIFICFSFILFSNNKLNSLEEKFNIISSTISASTEKEINGELKNLKLNYQGNPLIITNKNLNKRFEKNIRMNPEFDNFIDKSSLIFNNSFENLQIDISLEEVKNNYYVFIYSSSLDNNPITFEGNYKEISTLLDLFILDLKK